MISKNAQRRTIQCRRKRDVPPEPEECDDLDNINRRYTTTMDGEAFPQSTVKFEDGTILIFASAQHIRVLSKAAIWIMDGTFSTAPRKFAQIFTIHGSVEEGDNRCFVHLVLYMRRSILLLVEVAE